MAEAEAPPAAAPAESDRLAPPPLSPGARGRGITRRSIALGAFCIPFNVYFVLRLERVLFGPYPSTISLFPNAVFALFLLVGLNALVRRRAARWALNQAEMLTIYTMVAISTGLAGLDGVAMINQVITEGGWFATPSNGWSAFLGAFPRRLMVTDPDALRGHFLGNSTLYTAHRLLVWAGPILLWTGFVAILLWTAMCISVLVRRQWQDRERLTFPIVYLPMQMTDPASGIYRSRLLWGGFALAAGLGLYNGTAFLYPSLPMPPIGIFDLKPYFTAKPWSAIDWFPTTLYPLAIGLGYLLPVDLLFSCWFFFLFWKAQMVISNVYAWDVTPDFPFIREQGFGAVACLALFYLWTGRAYLAEAWNLAFGRPGRQGTRSAEEKNGGAESPHSPTTRSGSNSEALSYRTAFLGLAAGFAGLIAFSYAAGMALWLAVCFFVVYLAIVLVVLRIRAELGPPVHDFHFIGPDRMLPRALGVNGWRQQDLGMMNLYFFMNRAHRGDTPPIGLEGLYAAHKRGWQSSTMLKAVMLAAILGTFCTMWLHEHLAYQLGAAAKFNQGMGQGNEAMTKMAGWVSGTDDARTNGPAVWAMGIGFVCSLVLLAARTRFVGFPLHPIGYAISANWAIHLVWLPLLIAWLLKSLTLRYGGLPAYRRFLPFFLGLILGDCVQGSLWGVVSLILNVRTYSFFGA